MNVIEIDFGRLHEPDERQLLDQACRTHGFFALGNHGIDTKLQEQFSAEMQRYFARPVEEKLAQERTENNPFGFYNKELTKNRMDQKEIFDVSLVEATLWPDDEAFNQICSAWSAACHNVALKLLDSIFTCLEVSPEQDCFARHSSFLRLNYYPQQAQTSDDVFGVSHHTDAGALTLLLQEQVASLQFEIDGNWHTVPASPNHLLVNLGDMLQVWSNDAYRAPLHRVLTNSKSDRYSAPYFLNPDYAANVTPLIGESPRYRTINWQEFRSGRAAGDYADIGTEVQISHYRIA